MSDYGPAFFIKRKDGKDIAKEEQKQLLELTTKYVAELKIKDEGGKIAKPIFYDYDNYEKKTISFVIFHNFIWGQMPEDIQKDTEKVDTNKVLKIGEKINKTVPKTYEYKSYYVEV